MMSTMAGELTTALDKAGVNYELLPHAHTERAADEAEALGVAPAEVGKTLVLTTPSGYVRAVLPASERLDFRKLGELLGVGKKRIHLSTEDDLARDYPEFELGAVPPFGDGRGDRVLIDSRLAERQSVVVEAGSHDESVRLPAADLVRLADAEVADICQG
jgi:Ala-tRNA(Pro) deacylase